MYTLPVITERHRKMLQVLDIEGIMYHHILDSLDQVLKPEFRRIIHWKENAVRQDNLYHTYPFTPLKEIIKSKSNFYVSNQLTPPDKARPHIHQVTWLMALWAERNPYAPVYTSKTLSSGILAELNDGNLTISYQTVSRQVWCSAHHNPVTVLPLTEANLKEVINFQIDHAFSDWQQLKNETGYRPF